MRYGRVASLPIQRRYGTIPALVWGGGGATGGQTVGHEGCRVANAAFGEPAPGGPGTPTTSVVGSPIGAMVDPSGLGSAGDVLSGGFVAMSQDLQDLLVDFPLEGFVLRGSASGLIDCRVWSFWRRLGCGGRGPR